MIRLMLGMICAIALAAGSCASVRAPAPPPPPRPVEQLQPLIFDPPGRPTKRPDGAYEMHGNTLAYVVGFGLRCTRNHEYTIDELKRQRRAWLAAWEHQAAEHAALQAELDRGSQWWLWLPAGAAVGAAAALLFGAAAGGL